MDPKTPKPAREQIEAVIADAIEEMFYSDPLSDARLTLSQSQLLSEHIASRVLADPDLLLAAIGAEQVGVESLLTNRPVFAFPAVSGPEEPA